MRLLIFTNIICLALIELIECRPTFQRRFGFNDAKDFLTRYGYINDSSKTLRKALLEYQKFSRIPETGKLDQATIDKMKEPRCGISDYGPSSSPDDPEDTSAKSRWSTSELTYKISKYPSRLDKSEVDRIIHEAFSKWSEVTPLTFIAKTDDQVHLELQFVTGEHGDELPFNGPFDSLAHAFFPHRGGDIHFDDDESWSTKPQTDMNLLYVAVHEFGHSLGLEHSNKPNAVMGPVYRGSEKEVKLTEDDISRIQNLYSTDSEIVSYDTDQLEANGVNELNLPTGS